MSNETGLVTQERAKITDEQMALLKRMMCPDATDDEMKLYENQINRTQLDPFARQIYAIKRWNSAVKAKVMQVQVSIDGFRLIAQRSNEYRGQSGPFWCGQDGVWKDVWLSADYPAAAKVGVWRTGFQEPVWGVALWREYAVYDINNKLSSMWEKMPANQLSKCAEMLGERKAFPQELSGLYGTEEMGQADNPTITVTKDRKSVV